MSPSVRLWMFSNLALFPIEMFSAEMIYRDFFFLFWRRWNRTLNRTDQVHSQHICFLWWLPIHKCPMIYLFLELKACQSPHRTAELDLAVRGSLVELVFRDISTCFKRCEDFYCVNTWLFFGSCCSNNESLFRDLNPIFKMGSRHDIRPAWFARHEGCALENWSWSDHKFKEKTRELLS